MSDLWTEKPDAQQGQGGLTVRPCLRGSFPLNSTTQIETEQLYWAQGYRRNRVCIDTGLISLFRRHAFELADLSRLQAYLDAFLWEYPTLWIKIRGEFLELTALYVRVYRETIYLEPHIKVPNVLNATSHPLDPGEGRLL